MRVFPRTLLLVAVAVSSAAGGSFSYHWTYSDHLLIGAPSSYATGTWTFDATLTTGSPSGDSVQVTNSADSSAVHGTFTGTKDSDGTPYTSSTTKSPDAADLTMTSTVDGSSWQGATRSFLVSKSPYTVSIGGRAVGTIDGGSGLPKKKVTISARNTKDYPVTYQLRQDGEVVGSITLQPGQAIIQTFEVPGDTDVQLVALVDGLNRDGNVWELQDGATTEQQVGAATPSDNPPASPDQTPEPDTPSHLSDTPDPSHPTQGNAPVWPSTTPNTDPQNQTDLLTNSTYRQGVSTQTTAQKDANAKLDDIASAVNALKSSADASGDKLTKVAGIADKADAANADVKTNAQMQQIAADRQLEASNVIQSLEGVEGDTVSASAPSGSSIWDPQIGGIQFHLGPSSDSSVAPLAEFSRALLEWIFLCLYAWWCWNELDRMITAMATIPQAKGNALFMGTGGQVPALFAAMAITTAIFLVVPVLWAVATTADVTALWHPTWLQGSTSAVSGGIELLFAFVPVQFLLNLAAHAFVFRKAALAICIGIFSFIKVMVP